MKVTDEEIEACAYKISIAMGENWNEVSNRRLRQYRDAAELGLQAAAQARAAREAADRRDAIERRNADR